jgi:Domain of unknown function (DUF6484)
MTNANVIQAWPPAPAEATTVMAMQTAIVAQLVAIEAGRPVVAFDLGQGEVQATARVLLTSVVGDVPWAVGQSVLVLLERGDPAWPIVVGRVGDTLPQPATAMVDVQAQAVSLQGQEELTLRCGEASLVLRADGEVVLKGTRVLSRALESNKIRGATVLIN